MTSATLVDIARSLVVRGKGLLAIDESDSTCDQRFAKLGIPWSVTGQHTGITDLALTPQGEREARALRPCLRMFDFTRVLTSPALRARQTCDLAGCGGDAQIEPDLADWNYGDYEGSTTVEIQQQVPGWNVWRDGCPHGENPSHVAARADAVLARLRGDEPGHPHVPVIARWNEPARGSTQV